MEIIEAFRLELNGRIDDHLDREVLVVLEAYPKLITTDGVYYIERISPGRHDVYTCNRKECRISTDYVVEISGKSEKDILKTRNDFVG